MRGESDAGRRVRESAERARWHLELENGTRQRAPSPAQPTWSPTLAEVRYLDRADLDIEWHQALRNAGRAQFPLQMVELRRAAHLAGFLVAGDRLPEDRAMEHLHRAATRSGVRAGDAERVIKDGYLQGRAYAARQEYEELYRGGIRGHAPGAFTAVASAKATYDYENQFEVDPACLLPLPSATLIHRGHDLSRDPIGIGVPTFRDGKVHLDGVCATSAASTWTLLRTGRLRGVSIYAATNEFHRGVSGRLTQGTLVAVDLVRTPADDAATVGKVTEAAKLTPGQRQTQRLLDDYLSSPSNPLGLDLVRLAERSGAAVLDILAPIVAPLVAERGRAMARVGR